MARRVVNSINQLIKYKPSGSIKELVGKRFNKLLVTKYEGYYDKDIKQRRHYYSCLCDCGKMVLADYGHLKGGDWTSCGCYKTEHPSRLVHGFAPLKGKREKIYSTWKGMHSRCSERSKNDSARKYAEKGIKVCDGWSGKHGFENFKKDMYPPTNKSVDRIDNDSHYSCGYCEECKLNGWKFNCRWADDLTQSNNRSDFNKRITIDGIQMTLRQADRYLGFPIKTIDSRINRLKWSVEKAISTPILNNTSRLLYK